MRKGQHVKMLRIKLKGEREGAKNTFWHTHDILVSHVDVLQGIHSSTYATILYIRNWNMTSDYLCLLMPQPFFEQKNKLMTYLTI